MKRIKSLSLIGTICLVLIMVALLLPACSKPAAPATTTQPTAAAPQVMKWRVTTTNVPGTYFHDGVQVFADFVKNASGGRLTIETFPGGSLYPVFDSMPSVAKNVTEASSIWSSYYGGLNPLFLNLVDRPTDPMVDLAQAWWFWHTPEFQKLLNDAYRPQGVYCPDPVFATGPMDIFHSKVEIKGCDDFKGRKVRTGNLMGTVCAKFGASVITLSWPECYNALQLGTVDTAEAGGYEDDWGLKFQEVTKYLVDQRINCIGVSRNDLIVNQGVWDALPADLKGVVKVSCAAASLETHTHIMTNANEFKKKYLDMGIKEVIWSDAEVAKWQAMCAVVVKEWCQKTPETQQFLKIYREALVKFGYTAYANALQ